jgi:small subunit ribosomal protein S17
MEKVKQQKTMIGRVISNKMDKTVVVAVDTVKIHPLYKKAIKRAIKYKAHDEKNECGEGDVVRIIETRPLSKEKRWRVGEIITKKEAVEIKPEEVK